MCVCGFIHPSALEALEGDITFLKDVSLTAKAGQGSSGHSLPLRAREDPSTPEPARQWLGVSCSWAESFPRCRPLPTKSLLPLTGFSMPQPRACRSRTAAAVCPQHSTVPAGAHHPTCTLASQGLSLLMPMETPHCLDRNKALLPTSRLQLFSRLRMSLLFSIVPILLSAPVEILPRLESPPPPSCFSS